MPKPFEPYRIKQWNDDSAYSDFKDGTNPFLPWEFLRRNKNYQEDYERHINPIIDKNQFELIQNIESNKTPIDSYFIAEPPCLPGELLNKYKERHKKTCLTPKPKHLQKNISLTVTGTCLPALVTTNQVN